MSNVTPNDNVMDRLVQHHVLTEDGKAWLTRALDPFHDYELAKVGFPDHVGSASVIFEVQKNITISKPASLAAGAWDCHIVQTPLALSVTDVSAFSLSTGATNQNSSYVGILDSISASTQTFGGLVADCVPTGTPTFQLSVPAVDTRIVLDSADVLYASATAGTSSVRARLVSSGFEVENTTAPLYRQGAVTVYNSPSHESLRVVRPADAVGTAIRGQVTLPTFSAPPRTESRAKAFLGSKTWHAEHGVYVPSRFNSLHNPPQEFAGSVWCAVDQDSAGLSSPSFAPNALNTPLVPGTTLASSCGQQFANIILPVDNAGAYFTGLSEQTVLTLMVKQTWEIFPAADISLMRLAQPSPLYDPKALEAYSHIIREMPIGTIRGDNDAGRWFKMICRVAKGALPYAFAAGSVALGASALSPAAKVAGDSIIRTLDSFTARKGRKSAANPQMTLDERTALFRQAAKIQNQAMAARAKKPRVPADGFGRTNVR